MQHAIVSRDEWISARKAHLRNEKALTRMRDLVAAERRALPWVKVDKEYAFDTPEGKKTLAQLFGKNSQLVIHHFMFAPDWEAGCPSCSLEADHAEGAIVHLEHHDVTYVRVSRAPLEKILAYRKRMGWQARWVSSYGSDFNHDFHVSFTAEELAKGAVFYNFTETPTADAHDELPGLSAFYRDETGAVYHTYSTYARGLEAPVGTYMILDRAPLGRNETDVSDWMRRHDEYDDAPTAASCCGTAA
jgi:predicted dithiol-disulfide oxidoreductase (DUF899 family)